MNPKDFIAILFLFFLSLVCFPASGRADVTVTLTPDRSEATLTDTIRVVVSVSGAQKLDFPPALQGVDLFHVSPGGTTSRIEFINGVMKTSLDYTFLLQPKHHGSFQIGPAEGTVKGKTFKSNTARVTVLQSTATEGTDPGPLFLTSELSSNRVVVEEQAIYTLKLYRRISVRDITLNLPEMEQITFHQLDNPREYQSVYKGKPYQVLEVRYALFPSREGSYSLGPTRMHMNAFQPRERSPFGGFFDDPFFKDPFFTLGSGRPVTLTAESLDLEVLPLPMEGRPADFSGLVGHFELTSSLEPLEIKAGESATLTLTVQGRGNGTLIPDLKLPTLYRTKIYADQPVLASEKDERGLRGGKTMKWALVPEEEGAIEIPPLALSLFDTDTRRYRILESAAYTLSVLPGDKKILQPKGADDKASEEGPGKEKVMQINRDILPVHSSLNSFLKPSRIRPSGGCIWAVLITPFLLYVGTFGVLRQRKLSAKSLSETKAKRAAKTFFRKCRRGDLAANDLILFVRDYFNDRFALSRGALTPEEAFEILTAKGVGEEAAAGIREFLRNLEDAVYTGQRNRDCRKSEDLSNLIREIEREIR